MNGATARISWKDWVAAVGGGVASLLLMAQLVVKLAWDEPLGISPGLFVLGMAVLVMSAAIIFDRGRKYPFVSRPVQGLLLAAFVLIVAGLVQVV